MITVNGKKIETFNFSGGEVYVKVENNEDVVEIIANLQTSDDIMQLLMVTDAIRRVDNLAEIAVTIPYLPYARQDKITEKGESLSLKVFCDLINSQNYNRVAVLDVHSDTAKALLSNAEYIEQYDLLSSVIEDFTLSFDYLVSPDFGASKKIYKSAEMLDLPVIQANKVRNNKGEIIKTELYCDEDLSGKSVLIVDDICDGGRTFIELAKVLKDKGAKYISLYVTHGIFSKGLDCLFEEGIDKIYTTNSFLTDYKNDNFFVYNLG